MLDKKEYNKKRYEENKEYFKDYSRKYREKHRGYYKDYCNEYYKKNKENQSEYYKDYYKDHKEEILKNNKKWRENNKGDFIYFHINKDGAILYIGSTARTMSERQSAHLTKNSNLKMNLEEYIEKYNLKNIFYKDFSEYGLNRDDLYYIEYYFKNNHPQIIEGNSIDINNRKLSKSEEELISIADKVEFKQYKIF